MLVTRSLQWMLTMFRNVVFFSQGSYCSAFIVFVFYVVTLAILVQAIGNLHMFKFFVFVTLVIMLSNCISSSVF